MAVPEITLPDGSHLPVVGKGTYELGGQELTDAVSIALDAGYTHIDTAEGYMNEAEIGSVIEDHEREDLFLTSKVLPKNLDYESVIRSCQETLDRLGTDYLDLYLIHWPNPAISLRETLNAMAELHDRGLVRNIGVSNFSRYQLRTALHISDVPIAVNQIEYHTWFQRPELVEFSQANDVVIEAAAPLGRTEVFSDPVVEQLAQKYDRTPAQIVLRWAVEDDIVVIPRSRSRGHIEENIDLFDFTLDEEDHERLDGLDRDEPVYDDRLPDWEDDTWGIAR